MLEEKLERLKGVWGTIECYEGKYVISAKYPPNYNVYNDPLNRIKVVDDTKNSGMYWYVGEDLSLNIENIIDFIDETVNANIEAIKKAELYEAKVKELQEFFNNDNMSYQDLEALSFSIKDELNTQPIIKTLPKKPVVVKNDKKTKENIEKKGTTEIEKAMSEGTKPSEPDKTTQMQRIQPEEPKTANFNDFKDKPKEKERKIINNVDVTEIVG